MQMKRHSWAHTTMAALATVGSAGLLGVLILVVANTPTRAGATDTASTVEKRGLVTPLPSPGGRNPLLDVLPVAPEAQHFEGTLISTADAGNYTYFNVLDSAGEERWVAVLGAPDVSVGAHLEIVALAVAENFLSRRTHMTFETLHFGTVLDINNQAGEPRPVQTNGNYNE